MFSTSLASRHELPPRARISAGLRPLYLMGSKGPLALGESRAGPGPCSVNPVTDLVCCGER